MLKAPVWGCGTHRVAISELQLVLPVTGSCLCLCVWSRMWHVAHINCWTNAQFPMVGAKGTETACCQGQDWGCSLLQDYNTPPDLLRFLWVRLVPLSSIQNDCKNSLLTFSHRTFEWMYWIDTFVRLFYCAFRYFLLHDLGVAFLHRVLPGER